MKLAVSFVPGTKFWLMFAAGLAGGLNPVSFFAMPFVLLAIGARPSWRYARRLSRHVAFARQRARPSSSTLTPLSWLARARLALLRARRA